MLNPIVLFSLSNDERYNVLRLWYQEICFSWSSVFSYFSVWNLILSFFITEYFYENDLLYKLKMNVLLQTFLGGFYITYLNPCYIKIPYLNLIITDSILYITDFISHQLPFYFSLFHSSPMYISWQEFIFINIPISIYLSFFNYEYRYHINKKDLCILFFSYVLSLSFLISFLDWKYASICDSISS